MDFYVINMTGMKQGRAIGYVKDVTGKHSSDESSDVTNVTEDVSSIQTCHCMDVNCFNSIYRREVMITMATISFHNGGDMARRDHNIRNRKVTDKQDHIDPNGIYEIWHDEEPRVAYERIFGDALREYNERQKRPERKIRSYYNHIQKDGKKHTVYEVIISVGSVKNPIDPVIGKEILRKFCDTWKERNPTLEMIGCYYLPCR